MPSYQCDICMKNFNKKNHLDNHLNRKNKCKPIIEKPPKNTNQPPINHQNPPDNHQNLPKNRLHLENVLIPAQHEKVLIPAQIDNILIPVQHENVLLPTQNDYTCYYCNKSFVRKDVANKHMKLSCKILKQQNKAKQDTFDKLILQESKIKLLEEEIKNKDKVIEDKDKYLEEEIKILKDEIKIMQSITINNNSNNTTNNTVNVINIVPHGEEDLNKNKVDDLLLILSTKKGYNAVLELITRVHFNAHFPEFQNVYIPNIKNNTAMVFNEQWELRNIDDVISDLHDAKTDYITDNKDIFYKHLNVGEQLVYSRWAASMNNRDSAEYKEYITDMHQKIKLLIYNKRDMVIATKKRQGIKK